MSRKRLLISINSCWNFVNFRVGLVNALIAEGYEVVAVAPDDGYRERLRALGCRVIPVPMDVLGTSPIADAGLMLRYLAIMWCERPSAYMGYTIKPNVYGSLAAHLLGIPVINNIAGLGTTFLTRSRLNKLVRLLYRTALRRSAVVFFQNPEDREIFVAGGLVRREVTELLPGSGVDTRYFFPATNASHPEEAGFVFLFVGRMLWAKGVADFVAAARIVREKWPEARFRVLGILEDRSGAIDRPTIDRWIADGAIEFLGAADDVRPFLAASDCLVLPTFYPEGTPRVLLEAAAMGTPLIASDVPGCRQVVREGWNGFLCPPRDPQALAARMIEMISLPLSRIETMGGNSRQLATREFDERIVIDQYLKALNGIEERA